jgi:hypothetical protein
MQGTSGGRDLKARYYCANRSCDQPIFPAEHVEQQLAAFLTSFVPSKATQEGGDREVEPRVPVLETSAASCGLQRFLAVFSGVARLHDRAWNLALAHG